MTTGPHAAIPVTTARERFAAQLFDVLWDTYRRRVSYVQTYEQVIRQAGATFVNDHIAFRTLAVQQPLAGIASCRESSRPSATGPRAATTSRTNSFPPSTFSTPTRNSPSSSSPS